MEKRFLPEGEYKNILEKMPVCCVDLIIIKDNKVLVIQRKDNPGKGSWNIPGGRIYKNEKLREATVKKALEETGLRIRIKKQLKTYETMFNEGPFENLKSGVHTINVVFLAEPAENNLKVKTDKTSSGHKWISEIEEDCHPYTKKVLEDSGVFN